MTGTKHDAGKPRPSLIPRKALLAILEADVLLKSIWHCYYEGNVRGAFLTAASCAGVPELIACLEYGARKYGAHNWRTLDRLDERYEDAGLRHTLAIIAGEEHDSESGLPHMAHLACCLAFLLEHDGSD